MAIPTFQEVMLPLLEILADGKEHSTGAKGDVVPAVCGHFQLTEDERNELLPSGKSRTIVSRVGWAKTYLKIAGLVEQARRSVVRISDEGRKLLAEKPTRIDCKLLDRYPAYQEYMQKHIQSRKQPDKPPGKITPPPELTPEELLEDSYQTLRDALADDLLDQIKSCSPEFFERLVVELLVAMGYGGSIEDAGQAVGKSHDGGIDGIIGSSPESVGRFRGVAA